VKYLDMPLQHASRVLAKKRARAVRHFSPAERIAARSRLCCALPFTWLPADERISANSAIFLRVAEFDWMGVFLFGCGECASHRWLGSGAERSGCRDLLMKLQRKFPRGTAPLSPDGAPLIEGPLSIRNLWEAASRAWPLKSTAALLTDSSREMRSFASGDMAMLKSRIPRLRIWSAA